MGDAQSRDYRRHLAENQLLIAGLRAGSPEFELRIAEFDLAEEVRHRRAEIIRLNRLSRHIGAVGHDEAINALNRVLVQSLAPLPDLPVPLWRRWFRFLGWRWQ